MVGFGGHDCLYSLHFESVLKVQPYFQTSCKSTFVIRASTHPRSNTMSLSKRKVHTLQLTGLFGLGPAICNDDAIITGIRLPTCS